LLTSLCCERHAPVYPNPVTILITPGGTPASLKSYPNIKAVKGVC